MKAIISFIFSSILILGLIEAKSTFSSSSSLGLVDHAQKMIGNAFDVITHAKVRKAGRSITKSRLAWIKTEELMKMPLSKLRSIPPKSWKGMGKAQASKATASLISRLTYEQAKMIPARAVKAMPVSAQRAHSRLINRPSMTFRLTSMALAGGLAFVLYRYSTTSVTKTKLKTK